MKIIDLTTEHERAYFVCLEEWNPEMREAGDHKERWYRQMRSRGLRVKLAVDDFGTVGGMIQYAPAGLELDDAAGAYFIYCVFVHGYREGRGDFRGRGMGTGLLSAAEEDARSLGARGIAGWGLALPVWMRASWYRKRGYVTADRDGMRALMWKRFRPGPTPRWRRPNFSPRLEPGRVTVTAVCSGWCPGQNVCFERAREVAAEFGDRVAFHGFIRDVGDDATVIPPDCLFVDERSVSAGPPTARDKIRRIVSRRVRQLGRVRPSIPPGGFRSHL